MKSSEVLSVLKITRPTLTKYVKTGKIKATKLPTGRYDYDEDSVFRLVNGNAPRLTCIYGRVSTSKQKRDLDNQMETLKNFAMKNGYQVNRSFKDIASGISFKNRKQFFELLDLVIHHRVKYVIITYRDRLSRVGFDLFKYLFDQYHTQIIVMSDLTDERTDKEELFSEVTTLLSNFSMKSDSKRRFLK